MKSKIISCFAIIACIALGAMLYRWWITKPKLILKETAFQQVPGWRQAQLKASLLTFQKSCRAFIKQDPNQNAGTALIPMKVKDWQAVCRPALQIEPVTEQSARAFFQHYFTPQAFYRGKPVKGLFTGYYMPTIQGSRQRTAQFKVPIYGLPRDLLTLDLSLFLPKIKKTIVGRLSGHQIIPYFTRKEINQGAIKDRANVLLWIEDPVDRLFLEIQGSGIISLKNNKNVFLGYDAQNGAPYTAIASVLIKKGVMTKDNASMQGIKRYLKEHPKQVDPILNKNQSFVFFRELSQDAALGSQGIALTPGYSLAIDTRWIPMGTPLWLQTSQPNPKHPDQNKIFQRLMIAQDTGGAIRGKVRGDVFWGSGEKATLIAGHMKNEGYYWLLLPKHM